MELSALLPPIQMPRKRLYFHHLEVKFRSGAKSPTDIEILRLDGQNILEQCASIEWKCVPNELFSARVFLFEADGNRITDKTFVIDASVTVL